MSHIPVNHPLRRFYRSLAALCAIYVLIFGVIGLIQAAGGDTFGRTDVYALGLRTNLAFAIASVVAGGFLVVALFVGRNVDSFVNLWGGVGFMTVGTAMLALLNTDLNVLNFSMATVIVSFVVGMVLFSAGLYTRSAVVAKAG